MQELPGLCTHYGMDNFWIGGWEGHQASCEVNNCGSSSAMESTGAFAIWKRSVSKNQLRYTQMISDGDSKAFKLLSDQLPYGASSVVSKHECVGYVQKNKGYGSKREVKGKICE